MTGENSEDITMEPPHIYVERTLAIIKPDAVHKAEEIQDIILRSGFGILQVKILIYVKLDAHQTFKFDHTLSSVLR